MTKQKISIRGPVAPRSRDAHHAQSSRSPRADQAMVTAGLAESRERAQAIVMAGTVYATLMRDDGTVVERRIAKASDPVREGETLVVRAPDHPWVSRGGVKLAGALDAFGYDPAGKTVADFGASTGGFTDVLLARGASRVYAIDVGRAQLHARLSADPRVVVLDRTNARFLDATSLPEAVGLVVIDASFISAAKLLPAARAVLRDDGGDVIVMVKPQFEVGREAVGKGGVVRDDDVRRRAVDSIVEHAREVGLVERERSDSVLAGPSGNLEVFVWLTTTSPASQP